MGATAGTMELDCADWMCFSRSAGTRKRAAFLVLGLLVAIQAGFVFRAAVLVPQSSKDAVRSRALLARLLRVHDACVARSHPPVPRLARL